MKNYTAKTEARKLLKGVKSTQWGHVVSDIKGSKIYKNLSEVARSTDKALFIGTPTHPQCKDGFWVPKSLCNFKFENHFSDNTLIQVSIQIPYGVTPMCKEEVKHKGITKDNAIANFITRTGGDVYCNA
tara:strand:- start:338 stop:724 length:387 start_codon:yes stop_codon:yes gene_type:complete